MTHCRNIAAFVKRPTLLSFMRPVHVVGQTPVSKAPLTDASKMSDIWAYNAQHVRPCNEVFLKTFYVRPPFVRALFLL